MRYPRTFHPVGLPRRQESGSRATQRLWRSPAVVYSLLVLVFWLFGGVILGTILHMLHILIEVLELALEHLLEALFHVEGHTAQMYTAWVGFTIFMMLAACIWCCARRAKRREKLSRVLGKRALKTFHPRSFNARLLAGVTWSDQSGTHCRTAAPAFC